MATALRSPLVSTFLAVALLLGCPGKDGKDGATGGAGANSLVQLTPEPAGANCASGGTRVQSGIDANASGTLDAAEVSATQFVCNGAAGANGHDSLLATTPEPAGSNCANGGTRIQSGVDANDNGTLDVGEVASTQYVCSGAAGASGQAALVATSTESPGTNCGAGGIRVQSGIDGNGNATLDPSEVALTQFVCNGAPGASGADGLTSLVTIADESAGANCAWGGHRITSGLDADRSGLLDAAEVTSTQYVCDGAPGLNVVVATTPELAGSNCATGGTKVETGLDANRNGALDAGEGTATWYACNGANGSNGSDGVTTLVTVSASGAGVGGCLAGGAFIRSGPDASADGILDDVEVTSSQYLCNGMNGSDGAAGLTSLVAMTSIPGPADCAYGGTRIESGLDLDRGGTLGPTEITSTRYVCNGAPGADGADGADGLTSLLAMTVEPLGSAVCPNGGMRIVSGLDANGNGTLDATEEGAPQFTCNGADGAPGADGFTALVTSVPDPTGTCAYGGYEVQAGIDTNRSGTLDGGEVALTQYVCNGAPGAPGADGTPGAPATPWLVVTGPDATGTCQFGGSRIDAGPDTNGNGALDPGEESSTSFACNGAAGAGLVTVMGFTPEPAGPNCPFGGTKVESGLDLNGNATLDPGEATSTGYVCNVDASHPAIVGVTPTPGTAWPDATFCVTFSEAMDSSTIDSSSFVLAQWGNPVDANITYPSSSTACLDPIDPLWLFSDYTLSIGEGGTVIRDASGNELLSKLSVPYWVTPPPMPNLRVAIDSITDGATPGTFDVAFTVTNADSGAAGPFTVGFFVDPAVPPGVGALADASVDFPGLAGYSAQSATLTLTAGPLGALFAFVDLGGTVAETREDDNVGTLRPAVTGPIQLSATTVEEFDQLTVTVPVNSVVRHVYVVVGLDWAFSGYWSLGVMDGNHDGSGIITGTFAVPAGFASLGPVSVWAQVADDLWISAEEYAANSDVTPSLTTLSHHDMFYGGPWVDSGIPLTYVTFTPSTRPNLVVTIDSITDLGGGMLRVAYQVVNTGNGEAAPSTLGFFVDPPVLPGVGSVADATATIPLLPPGTFAGTVDIAGVPANAIVAFADLDDTVVETDEGDNRFVPRPLLTGPIQVSTTTFEVGTFVTITAPVGPGVRALEVTVGREGWWSDRLGPMSGNFAGEGFISGTFYIPDWWPYPMDASIWVDLFDGWGSPGASYRALSWVSASNLAFYDPLIGWWTDSGIPQTLVTISQQLRPNLVVSVNSIVPGAAPGTLDVSYTVSNTGSVDAGAFSVGFFADPATMPGVGSTPDATADLSSLAAGSSASTVATVTAAAGANLFAFADVYGAIDELNENDNLGRLMPGITGPVEAVPSTVEEGGQLTVTVPVDRSTRGVRILLGSDYWSGWSIDLGTLAGNDAGQGFITGSVPLPVGVGLVGGTWSVWVFTSDSLGLAGWSYATFPAYTSTELMRFDPFTGFGPEFTGISVTNVSVVASTLPNLRMRLIDAVPAAGGGLDATFLVNNVGNSDAGPFTVGIFVDPTVDPGIGSTPQASYAVPGLAMATQSTITINVPGTVYSRLLGFVDVNDEVAEFNESDNLGRMNPYMTGAPVVTPNPVELTGGLTVTVPVNFAARSVDVELGYTWGMLPTWWLGSSGGNWDGEREISATFSIPGDPSMVGTLSVWITVWDDSHSIGRRYVLDLAQSPDFYTTYNALTGTPLSVSTIPVTFVDVVDATHPNLTVTLGAITDGAVAGTVDVPYTVTNATTFDAGSSTLGFFVDPMNDPVMGDLPTDSVEIAPLPAGASASGTFTLTATRVDRILALADVLGAVVETNESDNLGAPPPALLGTIEATPAVVDEGTLLTLTIPVSGNTFTTEVWIGHDAMVDGLPLGQLDGNWENQGFISGSLMLPPGTASMGLVSVWLVLYDEAWNRSVGYAAIGGSPNYAEIDMDTFTWTDSGIPLTYVQIIPASRPNLWVTIDQVSDVGDGTVNVDYTVWNSGAGDAGAFDVGFFADPAALPDVGTPVSGSVSLVSLAMGASATGTVNLAGTLDSAFFAYADAGNAIDEQSETDNVDWSIPAVAMTGSPVPSLSTVAEGGALDVTVPVSSSVRRIEVYVGDTTMMGGGPGFLIGTATGNAAGEGSITAPCTAPLGSAGNWSIWVATYDGYGLEWRGFGTESTISTVYYSEYDPATGTIAATTIPLTSLTITP